MSFILHPDSTRSKVLENACAFLRQLDPGKAFRIDVKPYRKPRSSEANAYLWGVVYPTMVRELGHTDEDWHEFMCCQYFGCRKVELGGAVLNKPVRTTTRNVDGKADKLDSKSFWEFVNFVRDQAGAAGVYVPEPNE